MLSWRNTFSFSRKLFYLLLPIVLLYLIFKRIDFPQLFAHLKNAKVLLIMAGIFLRPMQIVLGSIRWILLNRFFCQSNLPASSMIYHYWSGLAIGYFTPGNLGWDAYRIIVIGKKLKTYSGAFITIVTEKFLGLFSVLTMALLVFPFVSMKLVHNVGFIQNAYILIALIIIVLITSIVVLIRQKEKQGLRKIKALLEKILRMFLTIIKKPIIINEIKSDFNNSRNLLLALEKPKTAVISFMLSLGILITAAICSQLIFRGLGYQIGFLINLFAAPVFFILFLIPISLGSIGVREGAFILLYGQFDVPMETALLVSFFNLFGLFLNNIVGALFILFKGIRNVTKMELGNTLTCFPND